MYCRHSEPGIHVSGNRNNISDRLLVYSMLKIYSDDVFKKKHSMEKIFFFPCIFFPCLIFTLFNKLQRIESAEILFFFYIFRNLRLSEQSLPRVSTSRGKKSQTRNDIVSEPHFDEKNHKTLKYIFSSFISQTWRLQTLKVSWTTKQFLLVMWIPRELIVVQIFRPWNQPGLTGLSCKILVMKQIKRWTSQYQV